MKIYINSYYEIKAINSTSDETLTEIEVVRETLFGNMSDFMILNYCYKPSESGYSVYPAKDYNMIEMLDKTENKISILEEENESTKTEQSTQNTDIKDNMYACVELCDMILSLVEAQPLTMNLNTRAITSHMSKLYFKLLISGDITMEDIPERYKAEVEELKM